MKSLQIGSFSGQYFSLFVLNLESIFRQNTEKYGPERSSTSIAFTLSHEILIQMEVPII